MAPQRQLSSSLYTVRTAVQKVKTEKLTPVAILTNKTNSSAAFLKCESLRNSISRRRVLPWGHQIAPWKKNKSQKLKSANKIAGISYYI